MLHFNFPKFIFSFIVFVLSCSTVIYAKEFQIILPISASGGNLNKLSSGESTNKFSSSGYGLAYIFENNIGLGYTSSSATYKGISSGVAAQNQTVEANALELSYFIEFGSLSLQLGLGSIIGGSVNKHEQSGVDILSSANSKHSINGSNNFGQIGYKFGGLNYMIGYRMWDYYAQHRGDTITRGVGNFNYSEIYIGIGF